MKPQLDVLPPPQRRFWPVFSELPDHFVLYGGTAIGLRLGGRQLSIGRVADPDRCEDNGVFIASLLDLAAQKMKVILARAEAKDYMDIYTLLKAGITLPRALGRRKRSILNSTRCYP